MQAKNDPASSTHAQNKEANNGTDKICKGTIHADYNVNEKLRSTTANHKSTTAKYQNTTHTNNIKAYPGDRVSAMDKNNIKADDEIAMYLSNIS